MKLCVTDAIGLTDEDTAAVTVTTSHRRIAVSSNAPKSENTTVTVTGTISDPGWLDTLSGTIAWGDGSAVQALGGTIENVRPNATLTFSDDTRLRRQRHIHRAGLRADDDTNAVHDVPDHRSPTRAPTATIDLSGAVSVNGTPTIIAHAGQSVAFSGRSTDPGSDDLTLAWTWGDGTPELVDDLARQRRTPIRR